MRNTRKLMISLKARIAEIKNTIGSWLLNLLNVYIGNQLSLSEEDFKLSSSNKWLPNVSFFMMRTEQVTTGSRNSSKRGFTLVELLLYMGIFLILLVVFLQLFSSILDVQLESQSTSAVDSDGKYIIARLAYDIENASSIVTPSSNGLTRSSLEVWSNGVDEDFVLTGGNLQLVNVGTGQTNNLNSADTLVSNVSFTRLGSTSGKSTITVTFTLTSTTHRTGGPETRNFTTTLGQR